MFPLSDTEATCFPFLPAMLTLCMFTLARVAWLQAIAPNLVHPTLVACPSLSARWLSASAGAIDRGIQAQVNMGGMRIEVNPWLLESRIERVRQAWGKRSSTYRVPNLLWALSEGIGGMIYGIRMKPDVSLRWLVFLNSRV
jgi:hypothetical protein